jgi:hypothetical protein
VGVFGCPPRETGLLFGETPEPQLEHQRPRSLVKARKGIGGCSREAGRSGRRRESLRGEKDQEGMERASRGNERSAATDFQGGKPPKPTGCGLARGSKRQGRIGLGDERRIPGRRKP